MIDQQSKGPAVESGTRTDPQPPSGQQQPRVPITSVHLRQHLIGVLAAVDMPETTRAAVVDELIAAGDVHQETFPHRAGAGDAQRPMLAHHAALTIRNPYPESLEKAPDLTGGGVPVSAADNGGSGGCILTAWDDDDDRVHAHLGPAAVGCLKRGGLLDVTLDTGERRHLVVVGDAEAAADGTVTFEVADAEHDAATERLGAIASRFDSTLGPIGVAAAAEPRHAVANPSGLARVKLSGGRVDVPPPDGHGGAGGSR